MNNKDIFLNSIMYFIKGAIVGLGAIIPGVSGGVLCVAFGIYEPMMQLLTKPVKSFRENYRMFMPFIAGGIVGFVFLAKAVEIFFSLSETVAIMLFFGLIFGTVPELFKKAESSGSSASWTPFVISLSLAYLMFHILESGTAVAIPQNFMSFCLSGFIWGLSLIIPGLSSSTLLIYFELYEPLTSGIGSLDFGVIIPFVIGIGITALLFARVVNTLFEKHFALMSKVILGFVIASSLKILPTSFESPLILAVSLACFGGGFAIARKMDIARGK